MKKVPHNEVFKRFLDDPEVVQGLEYFTMRWYDEYELEDPDNYVKGLNSSSFMQKHGFTVTRLMTHDRSFGFVMTHPSTGKAEYRISVDLQ